VGRRVRTIRALRGFWDQTGRDGASYLVAEAAAKGGIYIAFVWLATTLSVQDFGLLNVFVALLTIIGAGVGLGLPDGLLRFHFVETDFRAVLAQAISLPFLFGLLLLGAILPWNESLAAMLNMPGGLLVLALVAAPMVALRQSWLNLVRARREPGHYLFLRLVEPTLFLGGVCILLVLPYDLTYTGTAIAYVVGIAGAAVSGFPAVARRVGLLWSNWSPKIFIGFSLPLVAHVLAMTGLTAFDQVVLQQLLGSEITGIYAFCYRFAMAMSLLVFAVGAAWGPLVLRRLRSEEGESLAPLAKTAFRLLLISCIALAWIIPPAAAWVGGERYSDALHLIPIVVYAYLWAGVYSLFGVYLLFHNRSARLAGASGSAFLLNVLLNYITIPMWGATAAALTTVVSYILLSLLTWLALGTERSELSWKEFASQSLLAMPVVAAASLFFR
jgi:O-antigen/teichoic acid export membrane protein